MPFMRGLAPIRRTLPYLQNSNLVFKDKVKIFTLHYNQKGENHKGAENFVFWHLPQIQYKNPHVQVLTILNMTPSPFIRIFTDVHKDIIVDIENKSREEIFQHLKKIVCKSDEKLNEEAKKEEINPAIFGWGCERQCMCEIPGQVPCSGVIPLPIHMRGKYKYKLKEIDYKVEEFVPRFTYPLCKKYRAE